MATSYHYHCLTCNKTETEGITYKSISVLQELYQCWPLVRYIGQSSSIRIYLTEMAGPTYLHKYTAFLSEHYPHDMYLKSEYDKTPTHQLGPMPSKFLGLFKDAMGKPDAAWSNHPVVDAMAGLFSGNAVRNPKRGKVKVYMVVVETDTEQLSVAVEDLLQKGFDCLGGVAVIHNRAPGVLTQYLQAMTRREE